MLQIQHIRKEYRTGKLVQKALDDVSLNLRDSEFVAVLGPSGSGKTTLLNIIGGLDRYDSGDLIINGISTKKYKDRDWDSYRNHTIGFVFQSWGSYLILSNTDFDVHPIATIFNEGQYDFVTLGNHDFNYGKKYLKKYLDNYKNLDDKVLVDMKNVIDKENLNEENSKKYEDILKKQYTDLSYEITNEDYNGDEATITVKVNVYDLYKAQKDATTYLAENPNEFKDEDGKYDAEKFITYKLDKMKETNEKTSYTIDFYVVNTSDGWTVSSLSNSDIEKLHGIYDYES